MLENNKCEACRIGAPKVTDEEKKTFLKELPDWNILDDGVEKLIKDFCESNKISFRQIGIPLRVLITGSTHSASITDILEIIGKEDTIYRLKTMIANQK